ncbi:MAG: tail fiber domain-containing protein [Bacteroidales bacterium]|nr:tail fiber domain-containing protein [Bacteroidales bacterium]
MKIKLLFSATFACCVLSFSSLAQIKITSNSDLLIPDDKDIRWGPSNGQWAVEYWDGGLNFYKPYPTTNYGNYKFFLSDNNLFGFNKKPSSPYVLDIYGQYIRLAGFNSPLILAVNAADPRLLSNERVVFYNTSLTGYIDIECKVAREFSDSLFKTNISYIENTESALSKIKRLKGVNFNWKFDNDKAKPKKHAGLLAQQVERVIPEVVTTNDSTGHKLIAYSELIPYLIEAIKEQQMQIDSLKKLVNKPKSSLKSGTTEENTSKVGMNAANNSYLEQNIPNPFSQRTIINFYIAENTKNAYLYVYNMSGVQVKSFSITGRGKGNITIEGGELSPGMYYYTLITDGREIDTKKMILTQN